MPEVTTNSGAPQKIDYTPSSGDVDEGKVVLLGNTTGVTCGIAEVLIKNNAKGSLAVGGGIYTCVNLNNAANYAKVYWDDSVNKVTTVSTNNATFGFIVNNGAGGANTNCQVLHHPYV